MPNPFASSPYSEAMDVLQRSLSALTTLRNCGIIDASEFDERKKALVDKYIEDSASGGSAAPTAQAPTPGPPTPAAAVVGGKGPGKGADKDKAVRANNR